MEFFPVVIGGGLAVGFSVRVFEIYRLRSRPRAKLQRAKVLLSPSEDTAAIQLLSDTQKIIDAEAAKRIIWPRVQVSLSYPARVIGWAIYRRRIGRAEIDPNAKCPSCGARRGKIRWSAVLVWPDGTNGAVVHDCEICHAVWGEKPIVKASAWQIEGVQEESHGSDTPLIVKPPALSRAEAQERARVQPAFKVG